MTVAELIADLQKLDATLPVALADWSEGLAAPSMQPMRVRVQTGDYWDMEYRFVTGTFVSIGDDL